MDQSPTVLMEEPINMTNMTFKDNNDTKSDNHLPSLILNTYIGPILCVFGICGNLLSLVILFKGKLNESPYLYLKALSLVDMLALLLSLLHMTISGHSFIYEWQIFNAYIFFPLVNFLMAASVWLTIGVTFDRFIFVKAPLWARGYCSTYRARIRIIFITFFTFCISLPRFFCYYVKEKDNKYIMAQTAFRNNTVYYQVYDIICIALFHASPLVILILCNAYLIRAVHKARSTRKELDIRNNKEKDWNKDQRRFTITLISIVLLSIIAIIPSTIGDFAPFLHISADHYRMLRLSGNILLLCSLSFNFLLYCAFNTKFVRAMKQLFCDKNRLIEFYPMKRNRSPETTAFEL